MFSFSKTSCQTNVIENSLSYYLLLAEGGELMDSCLFDGRVGRLFKGLRYQMFWLQEVWKEICLKMTGTQPIYFLDLSLNYSQRRCNCLKIEKKFTKETLAMFFYQKFIPQEGKVFFEKFLYCFFAALLIIQQTLADIPKWSSIKVLIMHDADSL